MDLHSYNPVCFNLIIILHGNLELEWFNKKNYKNTILNHPIDTLIQSSYIWYIKQHLHYTGILVHTFVKVQHLFMDFQFTLVCAFNLKKPHKFV